MKIELNENAESAVWAIAAFLIVAAMAACTVLEGLG